MPVAEALSAATDDPIEESQAPRDRATPTREDGGTASETKPTECLSNLMRKIRLVKLSPEPPDLSMFKMPKTGKRGKSTRAQRYIPISDGFVGLELFVPPKQKRMRRFRGEHPNQCRGLDMVKGELPVPNLFREGPGGIPGGHSAENTSHATEEPPTGSFFDDDCNVAVSTRGGPERRIRSTSSRRRRNCLPRPEGMSVEYTAAEEYASEDREGPPLAGQASQGRSRNPSTRFELAQNTTPAVAFRDNEQGENEDEEHIEDKQEDEQEDEQRSEKLFDVGNQEFEEYGEYDGASSQSGSSSDLTTKDDRTHMTDPENILRREVVNQGGDSPDTSKATETDSGRIGSTTGLFGDETTLVELRSPLLPTGSHFRNDDLHGHLNYLALPGQAVRMKSSGVWMEVQEEIVFTPPLKSRFRDVTGKSNDEGLKSAISDEALGSSRPVPAAAGASVSTSERAGHDKAAHLISGHYLANLKGSS